MYASAAVLFLNVAARGHIRSTPKAAEAAETLSTREILEPDEGPERVNDPGRQSQKTRASIRRVCQDARCNAPGSPLRIPPGVVGSNARPKGPLVPDPQPAAGSPARPAGTDLVAASTAATGQGAGGRAACLTRVAAQVTIRPCFVSEEISMGHGYGHDKMQGVRAGNQR